MIILFHVIVAFLGLGVTALAYVSPSAQKLLVSYVLAGSTLLSGIMLLISKPSHLVPACIMGILYFGAVALGIFGARRKLQLSTVTVLSRRNK